MEIYFSINSRNTASTGYATIANSYESGLSAAISFFADAGIEGSIKCGRLGIMASPGANYSIYECYVDPGSDNYYYFAIESI